MILDVVFSMDETIRTDMSHSERIRAREAGISMLWRRIVWMLPLLRAFICLCILSSMQAGVQRFLLEISTVWFNMSLQHLVPCWSALECKQKLYQFVILPLCCLFSLTKRVSGCRTTTVRPRAHTISRSNPGIAGWWPVSNRSKCWGRMGSSWWVLPYPRSWGLSPHYRSAAPDRLTVSAIASNPVG